MRLRALVFITGGHLSNGAQRRRFPRKYSLVAKSVTVALASGIVLATGNGAWAAAPGEGEIRNAGAAQSVAGDYIVVFKDTKASAQGVDSTVNTLSGKFGGQVKHRYKAALRGYAVTGMTEQQAKRLAADPAVAYVQQDLVVKAADTVSNPHWHYDRLDQRSLPLNQSYTYPGKAEDVHAYVIDSGMNIYHSAWYGEGYHRASYGFNAIEPGYDPVDCDGHGTFVGGLISGHTGQNGVAKDVNLVAVKVLNCSGVGSVSTVAAGLDWVTANAVRPAVANMSLSGLKNQVIDDAVRRTIAAGVTVTAAAGNGDENDNPMDACVLSPASVPEVLTVSATDITDRRAYWANTGTCVDMFAPGVNVISTTMNGSYDQMDGTSMSAPQVAGAAAMLLQKHPDYTPAQVHTALVHGASAGVVKDPGSSTPNRMLYVRNVEPPVIDSKTMGLYNPRFGSTEVYARTADNHVAYAYKSGGWSEWSDLGGNVVGDPAVLYNPRFGTTEVYARTATNTIAYRYYSNGWSGWLDLGGDIAGDPAVLFNSRFGTTEVYARTADNRLVYKYFSNGWSGWIDLQGDVASDPGLLFNPRFGTTEAYVRTSTNQIQYRYYSNGWSGWINLEGTVAGDPAVMFNSRFGTTEVYTRTADNRLAYRYFSNGWSIWNDLGGEVASDPALLFNPRFGTTEAYVRNSANETQYRYFSNGWSGWIVLNGEVAGSPSLIYNPQTTSTEVYSRTPGSHAVYRYYANGWSGWNNLSL